MADGSLWPSISIVTPSLNQGPFIEKTIRSVLLQGYPNLEYIIIDGGSTDGTVEVIKKYEKWLIYWISEPDRGQSHAVNKGFSRASGDILAWLNSDDYYFPNVFQTIVSHYFKYPMAGAWAGGGRQIDSSTGDKLWDRPPPPLDFQEILQWKEYCLPQPSCFLNRNILKGEVYLNEGYHMQMDYDLWLRISKNHPIIPINQILSVNQKHEDAKTARFDLLFRGLAEKWAIMQNHAGIEFVTRDIESFLHGDIEIIYKLRNISQKTYLKLFTPIIKKLLHKLNF
ncbi:glycosyltransferase family 2 protein [Thermodesulfobacteriota bacterium]